jgi:hypothetical protein
MGMLYEYEDSKNLAEPDSTIQIKAIYLGHYKEDLHLVRIKLMDNAVDNDMELKLVPASSINIAPFPAAEHIESTVFAPKQKRRKPSSHHLAEKKLSICKWTGTGLVEV